MRASTAQNTATMAAVPSRRKQKKKCAYIFLFLLACLLHVSIWLNSVKSQKAREPRSQPHITEKVGEQIGGWG